MTITKQQWEMLCEDVVTLSQNLRDLQAEVDYLKYKRVPDLERRLEHGTNYDNNR